MINGDNTPPQKPFLWHWILSFLGERGAISWDTQLSAMFAPGFDEGFSEPPYALVLARSQSGGANFRSAATGKVRCGSGAMSEVKKNVLIFFLFSFNFFELG